jgi:hypothetical protein
VSSSKSTDVPIWRAWRFSSGEVLCARSVRAVQALIGSSGAATASTQGVPIEHQGVEG